MTRQQPALFDPPPAAETGDDTELVTAARQTVAALRDQNAIQPWHELDVAIVIETARGVSTSRGIAKSQMVGALLQARAKLPDPVVQESDDRLVYEADRELAWMERHAAADTADASHAA